MGPPTTARHRFAPTATMTITRTPARRTAIMDLSGSRVACLSAQARGSTGFTAAAFTALADSRAGSTAISTATAFAAEVSLTRALSAEGLPAAKRSEEHTSELQSHSDLVCRLLLEKKKKINK